MEGGAAGAARRMAYQRELQLVADTPEGGWEYRIQLWYDRSTGATYTVAGCVELLSKGKLSAHKKRNGTNRSVTTCLYAGDVGVA